MKTQLLRGGNTDEIYQQGTMEKSKMLVREHPDVAKVVFKYGRWHHHVDYSVFKNQHLNLIGEPAAPEPNEYGMHLVTDVDTRLNSKKGKQ